MSNLKAISEVAFNQCFPNGSDETKITKGQFLNTAKGEYALTLWLRIMEERREFGSAEVPSYLLKEEEFDVVDNEMDLSSIKVMRSLNESDTWLQDVGGVSCECRYIKTSINKWKLLCDDDSLNDGDKLFYPVGKKLIFPIGAHAKKVKIIYAHNGEGIDGEIEVEESIAAIVRARLVEIYSPNRVGKEDVTNNSNSEE